MKAYATQRRSEINISHEVPLYGAQHQDGCRNLYAARRTAGVTSARSNRAGEKACGAHVRPVLVGHGAGSKMRAEVRPKGESSRIEEGISCCRTRRIVEENG